MEDLEKAARQQGISFEDFKAQIRDQILTQQVVRDEVGRHLSVTSAEEQKYYSEHAKEFEQPEQVAAAERDSGAAPRYGHAGRDRAGGA